ncbi:MULTISPECIES: NYN domain-containing protein [Methylosinus]|uniref:NYN domain-containing protein n=1 Tax=Methylosinus trichosporium (strain ATCC 35070 / NCIMB 11131 / UNIQEM 75 / OB3b) TaxID=595536 RepID=A0A2D2D1N8_METT3|nr:MULTISPECIES: NYN domain-containing protein [Methylosinus]ATQ68921.1 NYN domain-containing protein [Methylosinus trichosporium OB3b]
MVMPSTINIRYMFIDGECLNRIVSKIGDTYFSGARPPLDWRRLGDSCRKIFYYDAIPVPKAGEDEAIFNARAVPKNSELSEIDRQPRYHVRTGEARHRRKRGNEQKMVDVQLAVDALSMASRGLFTSCTLITGDLDFKPLVSALVDMGVDVTLLFPDDETNDDLKAAADQSDALTIATLQSWISDAFLQKHQLPNSRFDFADNVPTNLTRLAAWPDERYGDCLVVTDANYFRLITERCPQNPGTHRLEITNSSATVLRAYAKDVFNIVAPEW